MTCPVLACKWDHSGPMMLTLRSNSPQMSLSLLCRAQRPIIYFSLPVPPTWFAVHPWVHSYFSLIEKQSQWCLHLQLYFFPKTYFFENIITRAKGNRQDKVISSWIWKSFSFGPHNTIIFSPLDTVGSGILAHFAHGVCPRCQDTTCHPGCRNPVCTWPSSLPTSRI